MRGRRALDAAFAEVRSLLHQPPHRSRWRALLMTLARVEGAPFMATFGAYVSRGLEAWPDHLREVPRGWLAEDAPGHAFLPLARRITAQGPAELEALQQARGLEAITQLEARFTPRQQPARPDWSMPNMPALEQVEVHGQDLGGEHLARWCAAWSGDTPLALRLVGCHLEDPALAVLQAFAAARPIRKLDLSAHRFTGQALADFLGDTSWTALRALVLRNLDLWTPGLRALAENPSTKNLEALDVWGGHLFTGGLEAICTTPGLPALRRLSVGGLHDGAECWRALRTLAPALDVLRFERGPLTEDALGASVGWDGPRVLQLLRNPLHDAGVIALRLAREEGALTRVTSLDLRKCALTMQGLRVLVDWPGLREVLVEERLLLRAQADPVFASGEVVLRMLPEEVGDGFTVF